MRLMKVLFTTTGLLGLVTSSGAKTSSFVLIKAGGGCPVIHKGDAVTFQFPYTYKQGDLRVFHEVLISPDGSEIQAGPGGTDTAHSGSYSFAWTVPDDAQLGKWKGKGIALVKQEQIIQGRVPSSPSKEIRRICFTVQ